MAGDFSRFTFDPTKHYNRVRMQQGRVQLDADWNEQSDMLNYRLEQIIRDLIGGEGAPSSYSGFQIGFDENSPQDRYPQFTISAGRYFVDGLACENEKTVAYTNQPYYTVIHPSESSITQYIIYLDVWEREISAIEDPAIREVALGGADTTTRTQIVWQVKLLPIKDRETETTWEAFVARQAHQGRMSARCEISYLFPDNHLYRVEVHQVAPKSATFKWSRDNGSLTIPVVKIAKASPAPDQLTISVIDSQNDLSQWNIGRWVEITNDTQVLSAASGSALCQIIEIHPDQAEFVVKGILPATFPQNSDEFATTHALMRAWDESGDTGLITIRTGEWIELEKGIQVYFEPNAAFFPGDYWLIPSRNATVDTNGGVDWPVDHDEPTLQRPHGIHHHFARLALIQFDGDRWQLQHDYRRTFAPAPQVTHNIGQMETVLQELTKTVTLLTEELHYWKKQRTHLVSEFFSEDDLKVGDVVAVTGGHGQKIIRVTQDSDTQVVGIFAGYSDAPLDRPRARVVTYGKAPCKVIGEVKPGDLLIPSEIEGCAQAAALYIKPGTVIGKALEHHRPGHKNKPAIIKVLVTLS